MSLGIFFSLPPGKRIVSRRMNGGSVNAEAIVNVLYLACLRHLFGGRFYDRCGDTNATLATRGGRGYQPHGTASDNTASYESTFHYGREFQPHRHLGYGRELSY